MTATDELRRLLDERGVEWWNETDPEPQSITMARTDEQLIEYHENANGSTGYHIFNMRDLTPEQAVEATLGRGTCKDTGRYCFTCSECGWTANEPHHILGGFWPYYCPNCGRKVVDE